MSHGGAFVADATWLDFVNTGRSRAGEGDLLPDAEGLARWAAARHLQLDGTSLEAARAFREELTRLADALAEDRPAPASAVAAVNAVLRGATGHQELVRVGGSWTLRFAPAVAPAALATIARSAARTLSEPLATVRVCAADGCTRLFAEDGGQPRRWWCDPAVCGHGQVVERRRSRVT